MNTKLKLSWSTRLLVCAFVGALAPESPAAATSPSPGIYQEEDELPDKRPEIKELLDQLGAHAGKRGKEDREAVALIDKAAQEFPGSGPKDRAAIAKSLDKCLKEKRKATEEGLPDNRLHLAAATALGTMGPESVKVLLDWIGHKQHEDDLQLQRTLILSLGKTKSEKGIKPMLKLLDHHAAQMQAAAAEALAQYADVDEKQRKEIFEDLLRTLMRVRGIIDQDQNEVIEHQRWEIISGPINTSLQKLSGHTEHDAHQWQRWWNKNKKADWDVEE